MLADPADADRLRRDARRWGIPVDVLPPETWWQQVVADGRPLLVHDALCPLVTAGFITTVLARGRERPDQGAAGVRTVTDTLKAVVDGRITETIDRDALVTVTSPVLVPATALDAGDVSAPMPVDDGAALVAWLRRRVEVELVRAPSLGRRIEDVRAVRLLESLDEVGHRVRAGAGHPTPVGASVAEDRP
ncbi:hypothetical protein GCM10009623_23210 [Nocardioides aestuarii]|uniref:2-C-methyl-D-erythritol 4-phosphate cytidylyltransferase n=1 Tax=Nocardioides aestuarii TaxID=252231 RepID=A0ABW4TPS1_9ACTN